MLVDLLGRIVGFRRQTYRYPTPETVVRFVRRGAARLARRPAAGRRATGSAAWALRCRSSCGTGRSTSMPRPARWTPGATATSRQNWRVCDMPVYVQNDATAACGAELVFGTGERPQDFLYFYIGFFIGGGLVLNGRLFTGRTGNAAGVGPMPVPGPDGRMRRLMTVASLSTLADAMTAAGETPTSSGKTPRTGRSAEAMLDGWIDRAAEGLASATLSAATLVEIDTVMIDGWMPAAVRARLVEARATAFFRLDLAGASPRR